VLIIISLLTPAQSAAYVNPRPLA